MSLKYYFVIHLFQRFVQLKRSNFFLKTLKKATRINKDVKNVSVTSVVETVCMGKDKVHQMNVIKNLLYLVQ